VLTDNHALLHFHEDHFTVLVLLRQPLPFGLDLIFEAVLPLQIHIHHDPQTIHTDLLDCAALFPLARLCAYSDHIPRMERR